MDNSIHVREKEPLRSIPVLFVYTIVLGVIGVGFVLVAIITILIGTTDLEAAPIVLALSLIPALILLAPFLGAFLCKKWGRIVNIIFLGVLIPIIGFSGFYLLLFMAFYDMFVGGTVLVLLLIAGFDIFYLFWFIANEKIFK